MVVSFSLTWCKYIFLTLTKRKYFLLFIYCELVSYEIQDNMKLVKKNNKAFFLSILFFIPSFIEYLDPVERNGNKKMKPVDNDDSNAHPNIGKKVYLDDI